MSDDARSSSSTPVGSASPKAPSSPNSLKRKHDDTIVEDDPVDSEETPKPKFKASSKRAPEVVEDAEDAVEDDTEPPPLDAASDEQDDGNAAPESAPCSEKNAKATVDGTLPQEYQEGFILCPSCGINVNIRDEATGGFTVSMWEEHRERCFNSSSRRPSSSHPSLRPSSFPAHPLGRPSIDAKDTFVYARETIISSTVPHSNHAGSGGGAPPKRRRAKRTEEERIEYLRADPYVAQFEAYRVLCASCDKWIRLRPNSTYCSIPWDAHRKSCLAKKINNKNAYALEERNVLFSKDPDIRKFDAERLLCNRCDTWLTVSPDDHCNAVQRWLEHRANCDRVSLHPALHSSSSHPSHPSHAHHSSYPSHQHQGSTSRRPPVPPLSQSHMALAAGSLPSGSSTAVERSPASVSPRSAGVAGYPRDGRSGREVTRRGGERYEGREVRGWNDLTPATFTSTSNPRGAPTSSSSHPHAAFSPTAQSFPSHASHESRRRNAEQRAATLRADALIGAVEANRVFCTLCSKWVQLRQDSSFCAYPWVQHRGKCLKRWERRRGVVEGSLRDGEREVQRGGEEEDELISDDGSDGAEHPSTTQGIKHEVIESKIPGPPPAKRRRVDGAPTSPPPLNHLTRRPNHQQSSSSSSRAHEGGAPRSARPAYYPYSSPYTVDARPNAGSRSQPQRPFPPSRSSASNGYPGSRNAQASSGKANGNGQRWDEDGDGDAQMDEGEDDEEGEGDVDAEGEDEDEEIQVLAHHPAPPLAPQAHYRGGERSMGGGSSGSCTYAGDRRGAPPSNGPSHRYPPPPSRPHHHDHSSSMSFHALPLGHGSGFGSGFGFADLDTPHGRRAFIAHSIFYLFSTTYEASDELPISSLLAYVNAAMPVDKYEEFDTGEVSRWVGVGAVNGGGASGKEGRDGRDGRDAREGGREGRDGREGKLGWRLEGDVVRVGRW